MQMAPNRGASLRTRPTVTSRKRHEEKGQNAISRHTHFETAEPRQDSGTNQSNSTCYLLPSRRNAEGRRSDRVFSPASVRK